MPADAAAEPAGALRWAARVAGLLAAAAFLALLAYGLLARDGDTTIDDSLAQSRPVAAPGFALDVLQRGRAPGDAALARATADGRLSLDELRGRPVVLNFWASWCLPCREEAPDLQRLWAAQRPGGLVVLGLDMQDVTDDARAFAREYRLTYPTVREGGNATARRYGTTGLPETYFIDARGRVVGHVIGAVSPAQLRDGAAAARAGRPLGVRQGGARKPG